MEELSDEDRLWQDRQPPRNRVSQELAVEVELEVQGGTRWEARCIDIHIGGILLEFSPDNLPSVDVDSNVFVTIQLDGEVAAKIPSTVRHINARRLGLVFSDLSTQDPGQENRLSRIVRNVEREILKEKNQQ